MRLRIAVVVSLVVVSAVGSAAAQTKPVPAQPLAPAGSVAVVISDAPIMLEPSATRTPLRVAAKGTTLVIDRDGPEWIQVTFNDPQYGLRQGFIQAKYIQRENRLEPQDLSVPSRPSAAPAAAAAGAGPGPVVRVAEQEQRPIPARPIAAPGRTPLLRDGFWFSAGLGFGALTCEFCGEDSYFGGLSGGLAAGVTVTPQFLIGGGTTGWARNEQGTTVSAGTFELRVRAYPSLYHGFFVNGGIGLGTVSVSEGNRTLSSTGLGGMYGVGWDIRTGRNVSVTPFWNGSLLSAFDQLWGFGQIGVGVTIH